MHTFTNNAEFMAKNQNTFAKRQREIKKRRKADEKRARRQNKGKALSDEKDPESLYFTTY